MDISSATLMTVALSKVLLAFFVVAMLVVLWLRKHQALAMSVVVSLAVAGFYLLVSKPLERMWWGNNGDELFVAAFLTQVLKGNPFNDFYYHSLPPFYPPLYFWLTGFVSKLFAAHAVTAAKFGVAAVLSVWFAGSYLWQQLGHRLTKGDDETSSSPWFWLLTPVLFFFLMDFRDIIVKPYEVLPALGVVLFLGLFAEAIRTRTWAARQYLFFGISGAALFLSYYFWWFVAIPVLFALALLSETRQKNLVRVIGIGAVMFALSAVYVVPLFASYRHGMENWQASFLVPQDFSTFLPLAELTIKTPLIVAGLAGLLVYHRRPFVRANLMLLAACFAYQFLSILLFIVGKHPLQGAKPFLFLGTASIAVGSAYLVHEVWAKYIQSLPKDKKRVAIAAAMIAALPFWPMTSFIDRPDVREQIEADKQVPGAYYLSQKIVEHVPDYKTRTWLTSGAPELNNYLPLHYALAHNPHFSHPVSKYSQRLEAVKMLAAGSSEDALKNMDLVGADALVLYKDTNTGTYPLFFWQDNYPNGGKEARLDFFADTVAALGWRNVYESREWVIFVK